MRFHHRPEIEILGGPRDGDKIRSKTDQPILSMISRKIRPHIGHEITVETHYHRRLGAALPRKIDPAKRDRMDRPIDLYVHENLVDWIDSKARKGRGPTE